MRKLKWDEYEIIECLGVLPEIDQTWYEWHRFTVIKDGLALGVDFCAYLDLVWISLAKENDTEPFITFFLHVRRKVVYMNEKNLTCLRFEDCVLTADEYDDSNSESNLANRIDFEIQMFPKFQLKFL